MPPRRPAAAVAANALHAQALQTLRMAKTVEATRLREHVKYLLRRRAELQARGR